MDEFNAAATMIDDADDDDELSSDDLPDFDFGEPPANLVALSGNAANPPPSVMSTKDQRAEQVRSRVLQVRDQISANYFELGSLLYEVHEQNLWALWKNPATNEPYTNFIEYVETEADCKLRKAYYLMAIWWWFGVEQGHDGVVGRLHEIGWNKAARLVGVATGENLDAWLNVARDVTLKELEIRVRAAQERAGVRRPTLQNFKQLKIMGQHQPLLLPDVPRTAPQRSKMIEVVPSRQPDLFPVDPPSPVTAEPQLPHPARPAQPPQPPRAKPGPKPRPTLQGVDPLGEDAFQQCRQRWAVLLDDEQRKNVESACDLAIKLAEIALDGKGAALDYMAMAFHALYSGTFGDSEQRHRVNARQEVLRAVERNIGIYLPVGLDPETYEVLYGDLDEAEVMIQNAKKARVERLKQQKKERT